MNKKAKTSRHADYRGQRAQAGKGANGYARAIEAVSMCTTS
jgi:hypothetical protein